jgi:hypothetical protein
MKSGTLTFPSRSFFRFLRFQNPELWKVRVPVCSPSDLAVTLISPPFSSNRKINWHLPRGTLTFLSQSFLKSWTLESPCPGLQSFRFGSDLYFTTGFIWPNNQLAPTTISLYTGLLKALHSFWIFTGNCLKFATT